MITAAALLNFVIVVVVLCIIGVVIIHFLIRPLAPATAKYPLTMLVIALLVLLALVQLLGYGISLGGPPILAK